MKSLCLLITAGPTRESLDPVRYLSNHSSGKMGYALAQRAIKMGHRVILISGPVELTPPPHATFIPVMTAQQMYKEVMKRFKKANLIIKVAAVADYRPRKQAKQKIKKGKKQISLTLIQNPDILKTLGQKISQKQLLVGFAAETQAMLGNAKKKLVSKKAHWIIANDVGNEKTGFGSDRNRVTLLSKWGEMISLPLQKKEKLAQKILKHLIASFQEHCA